LTRHFNSATQEASANPSLQAPEPIFPTRASKTPSPRPAFSTESSQHGLFSRFHPTSHGQDTARRFVRSIFKSPRSAPDMLKTVASPSSTWLPNDIERPPQDRPQGVVGQEVSPMLFRPRFPAYPWPNILLSIGLRTSHGGLRFAPGVQCHLAADTAFDRENSEETPGLIRDVSQKRLRSSQAHTSPRGLLQLPDSRSRHRDVNGG
jgi:hypothetical protein